MFEDSLLESGNRFKKGQQTASTVFSFVIQAIFVGIAVLIPLIYTDALPSTQLMTFLVAPPPPPPPPPPPAAVAVRVVRAVSEMVNGQLRTPTAIPKKVEMIKEEEAPPAMSSLAGVVGGTGTGGSLGGVMGGIIGGAANVVVPKAAPVQRIRVSQGVSEGLLLHKVTPNYPPLARQARIQGSVILAAVISKTGTIENLHLQSGHPMLAPAAIEAVKQWKYKPYFLNGEPVEVETVITVNFTLAGG